MFCLHLHIKLFLKSRSFLPRGLPVSEMMGRFGASFVVWLLWLYGSKKNEWLFQQCKWADNKGWLSPKVPIKFHAQFMHQVSCTIHASSFMPIHASSFMPNSCRESKVLVYKNILKYTNCSLWLIYCEAPKPKTYKLNIC